MNRSVGFSSFQENPQGVVYNNSNNHSVLNKPVNTRTNQSSGDKPIPKPVPDFWRPNFISKFINYRPLRTK